MMLPEGSFTNIVGVVADIRRDQVSLLFFRANRLVFYPMQVQRESSVAPFRCSPPSIIGKH
jgi:hypothetical protein